MNPLLGFVKTHAEHGKSTTELDLQERSTKKVKEIDMEAAKRTEESVGGRCNSISFRDIIIGQGVKEVDEENIMNDDGDDGMLDVGDGGITIEEEMIGGYERSH